MTEGCAGVPVIILVLKPVLVLCPDRGLSGGVGTGLVDGSHTKDNVAFPSVPCPCPTTKSRWVTARSTSKVPGFSITEDASASPLVWVSSGGSGVVAHPAAGRIGFKEVMQALVPAILRSQNIPVDSYFLHEEDIEIIFKDMSKELFVLGFAFVNG